MSFKDTFARDSSGKQNLQYDDVAFHHFFITILLVVAIPLLYSIIKTILNPFGNLPKLKDVQKKRQFQQKITRFKKDNKFSYITFGFFFKVLLLVALLSGAAFSLVQIRDSSQQLKGFDPYQILGVEQNAPVQRIKKAYRKLALLYHPDRNKDNPQASAKFIMISKAYECLTDQQAKQKCIKYGNPEGRQSFNVGIALPSFLIRKENHVAIMGVVFVLIVIILPAFLIHYHSQMNKYDDFGMLYQNHTFIHGFLNQHFSVKDCVKTLSICNQFKDLKTSKQQVPKLQVMLKNTEEDVERALKKNNFLRYIKKSMLLIAARINGNPSKDQKGIPKIPRELQEDFRFILKKLPVLIKATIMIACGRSTEYFQKTEKFVGLNALQSLVWFGQYFIQGKSFERSNQSFEQLDLTTDEVEKVYKKKKNKKITDLKTLLTNQTQKQYFLSLLEDHRRAYIQECLDYFPRTQVIAFVKTQAESQIATYDAFKVMIQAKSNRKSSFCGTNNYPFLKVQGWWVVAANGQTVVFMEHFNFDEQIKQFKFDLRHDKPGSYSLTVYLYSDCYFGLDIEKPVKYQVKPARKFNEQQEQKHETEEEQSFFSKMMQSIIPTQQEEVSDKQDNDDEQKPDKKIEKGLQQEDKSEK